MLLESGSPQRSVRQALTELQLKTKLLEEERDHFVHLQLTTARAFADHRAELEGLLAKERQYATAQEERLRAQLQRLKSENALIESQHSESRRQSTQRLRRAVAELQAEGEMRERRLAAEVDVVRDELRAAQSKTADAKSTLEAVRAEVDAEKRRQLLLQSEVEQLTQDNMRLSDEAERGRREAARASAAVKQRRQRAAAVTLSTARPVPLRASPLLPAFIPSGKTTRGCFGRPATSNVNAVVQTIRNANIRSPPRTRRSAPGVDDDGLPCSRSGSISVSGGSGGGHQLDAICRSLIAELLELRAEYDAVCTQMESPRADAGVLSSRLRHVFASMDHKMTQLRRLRVSQHKLDDEARLHEMFAEVARENNHCTRTLQDLINVIRQPA